MEREPDGKRAVYLLFVLVLGFVAGAFVWLFFLVMDAGISFLWDALASRIGFAWYPVILCAIGGAFIGLYEKRHGPLPPSLESVMADVKKTHRYDYGHMGESAIAAVLPLLFGGSIGPEAGLTGVIAGLCTWASDRMKLGKTALADLSEIGISATLGAVFNAPLFAFVAPLENERDQVEQVTFPGRRKLLLNITAIIGAMAAFGFLGGLFGENGGLYRFDSVVLGNGELLWAIPLIAVGVLMGVFYEVCSRTTGRIGAMLDDRVVLRAVITGLILGCIGSFLPYTMFAGETQMSIIVEEAGAIGAWVLIATGLVKLFTGPLCINGGWRGGNIFPVIFSGAAVGIGIALLTGIDPSFCCAVVCGALCGVVMGKPLFVIMLLALCFPLQALIFVAVAAVAGSAVCDTWSHDNGEKRRTEERNR